MDEKAWYERGQGPVLTWWEIDRLVEKDPDTGCWNWKGPVDQKGYGRVNVGERKYKSARRATWEAHEKFIRKNDMLVDTCANTSCVAPDHMQVADRSYVMKRLAATRERISMAIITWEVADEIRQMRKDGMKIGDIAAKVGIGYAQVSNIIHYRAWVRRPLDNPAHLIQQAKPSPAEEKLDREIAEMVAAHRAKMDAMVEIPRSEYEFAL